MAADSAGREKDLRALLAQLGIENRVQTQLTRDARGSLEVFDPSRKTIKTIAGPSSVRLEEKSEDQHEENVELRKKELEDDEKNRNPSKIEKKIGAAKEVEAAAKRAAEWGLILKADAGSTTITGVEARRSREDKPNNALGASRTSGDSDTGNEVDDYKRIPRLSKELKDVLSSFEQTFVVADALDPNHPVLYASAGFFTMTGYTPNQVIGKNCRFLQGADTDPVEVAKIRAALNAGEPFCGRLLNYKKNGTAFWNLLTVAPIKDESGKLLKFIGMLVEVSKYTEGGKDRALRPNGLSESLIKYDERQKDKVTSSLSELLDDVQGLFSTKKSRTDYKSGLKEISEAAPIAKEEMKRGRRRSGFFSLFGKPSTTKFPGLETLDEADHMERVKEVRKGIDLATTLERIEKNFVITDPRLPDNPIIFASDSFLELTEYTREEILGRNCRFLQGPGTDPETVQEIRDAIREQKNITVQILNYTKSGKPFWNIFHLQAMRDSKGELQYFIGVQLDGSAHFDPNRKQIPNQVVNQNAPLVQSTAVNVNEALKELPDANMRPNDLWFQYSKSVVPKPHKLHSPSWKAIAKGCDGKNHNGKRFRHIKPLGSGDTGIVHLVELDGAGEIFALKAMKKELLLQRNKVHRACAEREILNMMDHPFLPTLYATFQTTDHICLITDYCSGGELFHLLDKQPSKVFQEKAARFYAAEVVIALEYLHYMGVVYRDLKPENILIQSDGHVQLTDFDLSLLAPPNPQVVHRKPNEIGKHATIPAPTFFAEPVARSNSFVGTEEYIAPEVISGLGHSSAVDWWALGILLYEMLYGHTPFRGKNRQRIFSNILHKSIAFSNHVPVSVAAKELMHELLQKDPSKRLGSQNGAYDIKQHSFFKGINWPLLRNTVPPKLVVSHKEMVHKIDGMTQDARWVDAEKDIFGSSGLF